jgi:hypothetical protein
MLVPLILFDGFDLIGGDAPHEPAAVVNHREKFVVVRIDIVFDQFPNGYRGTHGNRVLIHKSFDGLAFKGFAGDKLPFRCICRRRLLPYFLSLPWTS